ncbi:uncharacterized protein [Spinacia oleracea]|uniref:PLAT domain-containing protein n=1 Tax=Spinacia oleracea TaxID=3562 RepID=A0ABM3RD03_SPIOL|nr:uncharacterized protein LOC130468048 [Spinacia oleracea]
MVAGRVAKVTDINVIDHNHDNNNGSYAWYGDVDMNTFSCWSDFSRSVIFVNVTTTLSLFAVVVISLMLYVGIIHLLRDSIVHGKIMNNSIHESDDNSSSILQVHCVYKYGDHLHDLGGKTVLPSTRYEFQFYLDGDDLGLLGVVRCDMRWKKEEEKEVEIYEIDTTVIWNISSLWIGNGDVWSSPGETTYFNNINTYKNFVSAVLTNKLINT